MSAYDNPTIIQDMYGAKAWAAAANQVSNASVNMVKSFADAAIKRAEKVRKDRGGKDTAKSFILEQTSPIIVAPAQRSQLLIKAARGYVADARAFALQKVEKLDTLLEAPFSVTELKSYKSLSARVNAAANEYYRQQNEFVYDKDQNPIEPSNIYLDREYFTIQGPLTKESWSKKKNVLVDGLGYAKATMKKDFGK